MSNQLNFFSIRRRTEGALNGIRRVERAERKFREWTGAWDSLQDKASHGLYFENLGPARNPYLYERLPNIQRLAILLSTGNMFELFLEGPLGDTANVPKINNAPTPY